MLLPTTILWLAVVGTGLLIVDVIALDERAVSDAFVEARTDTLDSVSAVISEMGNTQVLIATCLLIVAFIWWQSRQWWFAIVPALALGLEALVFLTSSLVIGRPRPEVEQLDHAPPTSSFPSGHTGASTAVYLAFALCATRIGNAGLRITIQVLCVAVPVGVGVSRVYRGMHHPSDVIAGFVVGTTCALIAWNWLPLRDAAEGVIAASAEAGTAMSTRTTGSVVSGTTSTGVISDGGEATGDRADAPEEATTSPSRTAQRP
ncbi:phosphatase PAP2 family protein [Demequina sp. NBRC 110053]|uniref:phosphatase PAP2 family protein n=1 Tax=Demequina sp. NBRC 110053 TaxID=1570342 RepID=UPI001F48D5C9|nr:phosphatase PAP2 family protein [Demequina sp. NBRC 110053]